MIWKTHSRCATGCDEIIWMGCSPEKYVGGHRARPRLRHEKQVFIATCAEVNVDRATGAVKVTRSHGIRLRRGCKSRWPPQSNRRLECDGLGRRAVRSDSDFRTVASKIEISVSCAALPDVGIMEVVLVDREHSIRWSGRNSTDGAGSRNWKCDLRCYQRSASIRFR